ncbi:MAG: oxidoreductase [Candidatus Brockarchaeota archaeon]|nr:oxidoreductase [Candidatus Brockarchaeota archaeon]
MTTKIKREDDKLTVAVIGASGTAGSFIVERLLKEKYNVLLCEKGEGVMRLRKRGLEVAETKKAIPVSDVIIMAVPDDKIGEVSRVIVPIMKKDAIMILLDAAAAYIGDVSLRGDCTFAIAHPCHPRLFQEQEMPEAYRDYFGGTAKQDIVIALLQGKKEKLEVAEKICREVFAPVVNCYKLSVDQIAVLEPIASEIVVGAASYLMKESFNEAVKLGIPEEAARSFLLGHIRILLAVLFGESSHKISKAAENGISYGCSRILKPRWKEVFNHKEMKRVIRKVLYSSNFR